MTVDTSDDPGKVPTQSEGRSPAKSYDSVAGSTWRFVVFSFVAIAVPTVAFIGLLMALSSLRAGHMRRAVTEHGWSGTTVHCRDDSRFGDPRDDQTGLIWIGSGKDAALAIKGCTPVVEITGGSYFVVTTASDRTDVRLTNVRGAPDSDKTSLVVEHYYPGKRCGVTADWKGKMVLVLRGPDDSPNPKLEYRSVSIDC